MKNTLFLLSLLFVISSSTFAQPQPGHNTETRLAEVGFFGGIQHRLVVFKSGKVKYFLGTRNGYIAQLNQTRVALITEAIAKGASATQNVESSIDSNCQADGHKYYFVFDKNGQAIKIREEHKCGHSALTNFDSRIKTILDGLLALGDLENQAP